MCCVVVLLVVSVGAGVRALSDEEYYSMPQLFQLDEYNGCLASRGVYCLGIFELSAPPDNQLYRRLQEYSSNWVKHSNHTRIYRGVCLSRRCAPQQDAHTPDVAWFASCVNSSVKTDYGMSSRLLRLYQCTKGEKAAPFTADAFLFLGLVAFLLILAVVSTTLDMTLPDHNRSNIRWALSWSLPRSWSTLTEPAAAAPDADLRFLDGLRVLSMLIIILLHTCGLLVIFFIGDTRFYEQKAPLALMFSNFSLVVQVFLVISSFLMANKQLKEANKTSIRAFARTMIHRIVRIAPSYFFVVFYAASLHRHSSAGPQWAPLVRDEVLTCRRKWWLSLLFLNNFNYVGVKCIAPTWYLAADMQLYAAALLLTLLLRGRRALAALSVLIVAATLLPFTFVYTWNFIPNYALHSPDNFRREYSDVDTFNFLYQSPAGNAVAALMGLLLAHAHHALQRSNCDLSGNKMFRLLTMVVAPSLLLLSLVWPALLAPGALPRLQAALLATLERTVFCLFLVLFIFGFLQGLHTPLRRMLSSGAATLMSRLSLGVLLVHFPIHKSRLGSRSWPEHVSIYQILFEWFGVLALSYALAVLLALLVELPAQRLYRELSRADRSADKRKD